MNETSDPQPPATQLCRTSVLAAMFAVPLCCPPMTLLATVTGLVALRQIRRDASLHGRGLAWAAVIAGVLSTLVFSVLFWRNGLNTLWRGPNPPVSALLQARPAEMPLHWSGPAATATTQVMQAFAAPLQARHGAFRQARNSASRLASLQQDGKDPVITVPITLVFERAEVEADLGLERFDARGGGVVMKWRNLRVLDPGLDNPVFPPGDPGPPPLAPPAPGKPGTSLAPASASPLR
ncbi:MAG: DUF4190 domain-containing protein [Planctomycetes bacterium]|nr:DUF4190 domain-containing protein [Planctomycetota bacterium]